MPKPKLFATIAGVKIYHVHKAGYGEGRELNFHYSTLTVPTLQRFLMD